MDAKLGKSSCAELAPAVLTLPGPEAGLFPAGDSVPELEELLEQVLDQEKQAERDDGVEEPEATGDSVPEQEELLEQVLDQEKQAEMDDGEEEPESKSVRRGKGAAVGAAIGIGAAVIGAPVAIWAVGFTGAGIAAGSFAAKMMSSAAIANGGGVAAGSLVAGLQSAGAVGLSLSTKAGLSAALGSVGAAVGSFFSRKKKNQK